MSRHVAFLRAVNVGGRVVKMDHLRRLFEELGLAGVETFIASGNVIFDSASTGAKALERRIESHLAKALGFDVATFIRSTAEVAEIARSRPFGAAGPEADGNRLYVAFLADIPRGAAIRRLLSLRTDENDFRVSGREAWWLCRVRFSESGFSGALLEKTLGMSATLRNVTTVRKIAARYS